MSEKKITITTKGASQKQYSTLVLELNSMSKAWKKFGVDIKINSPSSEKIIRWGNRSHDERNIQSEITD